MSLLPVGDGVGFIFFFSELALDDWISLKCSLVHPLGSWGMITFIHSTNLYWFHPQAWGQRESILILGASHTGK